ncbi:hypothetical protein KY290_000645 [Solanum tuberosum]|uniref:Phytocyanin domain-containing protein n=1 Tax=Solanum tuberosum TaxID=4113 RepID=A0ABQ7WJX3_SOLTU|nr:hypothetical protein KY289_000710 [Solanum tuberosum]KAH0781047.1 hypothetical protein KY290_000645 [Solanum tuberosum]
MVASTTAVVYEVGDSQGWIIGNIDYSQWASTKNFHVNDILVFNYNNKYHNVMQVSKQEYESCTITNPIATFNTGKDLLLFKPMVIITMFVEFLAIAKLVRNFI